MTILFTSVSGVFDGMSGDDFAKGGGTDDVIRGFGGRDFLKGGGGDDMLKGGGGDDKLAGGNGDDTLNGGNGSDHLTGGKGNDKMSGGAGDDTLVCSQGDNKMSGGSGADTFVFSTRSTGDSIVQDFELGVDKYRLNDATAVNASLAGNGSDVLIELDTGGTILFLNMGLDDAVDLFGIL